MSENHGNFFVIMEDGNNLDVELHGYF
jgi:hypothetical protein